MKLRTQFPAVSVVAAALWAATATAPAGAADAAAAEVLARQNGCLKCHAVDKPKEGPSYTEVAAKYKGKPGAEAQLIHHITTAAKAKFPDGHEEEHKVIKTRDMNEIKNLVGWILSL